jgi:hypothetical protein
MRFRVPWFVLFVFVLLSTALEASDRADGPGQPPTSTVSPLLTLRGLVTLCQREDPTSRAGCGAYISGFVAGSQATRTADAAKLVADRVVTGAVAPTDQAMDAAATKLDKELRLFCIRAEWTAGYVGAVVVQYGREHEQQLGEPTAEHMMKILAKAFPCG